MIFVKTFDTNTRQLLESDLQLHKQLKNLQFHIFFKILTPIKFISNSCHQNIKQISLLIFQRILQQIAARKKYDMAHTSHHFATRKLGIKVDDHWLLASHQSIRTPARGNRLNNLSISNTCQCACLLVAVPFSR